MKNTTSSVWIVILEVLRVPLIVGGGVFAKRTYKRIKVKLTDQETENGAKAQNKAVEESQEVIINQNINETEIEIIPE